MDFLCRFGCDRGVRAGVTQEETAVLIRWKKRPDNHVPARMKAEAILYASEGVSTSIIAKIGRAGREDRAGMAGRVAGHQDVLGPDRPCGEPERGGTRPRPEARTQENPRPATLPGGHPRRVLGRPGDT